MIIDHYAPLDGKDLASLAAASTATITTQLFKRGLRNTYLAGLGCMSPNAPQMIGEAFTLRCIPAREDIDVWSVYDYGYPQRRAVESVDSGQGLVIDCREERTATPLAIALAESVSAEWDGS